MHNSASTSRKEFEVRGPRSTLELAPCDLGQVYMATRRFRQAVVAFTRSRG
jgi:hypothetical protein